MRIRKLTIYLKSYDKLKDFKSSLYDENRIKFIHLYAITFQKTYCVSKSNIIMVSLTKALSCLQHFFKKLIVY